MEVTWDQATARFCNVNINYGVDDLMGDAKILTNASSVEIVKLPKNDTDSFQYNLRQDFFYQS